MKKNNNVFDVDVWKCSLKDGTVGRGVDMKVVVVTTRPERRGDLNRYLATLHRSLQRDKINDFA